MFAVTGVLSPEVLTPCAPWLMALCGYGNPRPEGRASLLTLTNRVNAAGSGFGPDVIFSVDSNR
jgi:hypothetical protein